MKAWFCVGLFSFEFCPFSAEAKTIDSGMSSTVSHTFGLSFWGNSDIEGLGLGLARARKLIRPSLGVIDADAWCVLPFGNGLLRKGDGSWCRDLEL